MSQSGNYDTSTILADIETLTTDDANVVGPDGAGNVNLVGGTNIGTTGAVANTATINLDDTVTLAGNLNMPDTTGAGTAGVITFGTNRFISNYGTENTFIGEDSGNIALTGTQNTVLGHGSSVALTTAIGTVSVGFEVLELHSTGDYNTAVGHQAGNDLLTGSYNTLLGGGAGFLYVGAESSNICIENQGVVTENNTIHIGTQGAGAGQQNACYIAGIYNTATVSATKGIVLADSNGQLGSLGSATDGQIPIGSTGVTPVLGVITSTGGTLTITNGAGTINLESCAAIASSYLTDDANSAIPALGVLTVAGGANIGTSSAASTVTVVLNGTTDHAVQVGNATGSLTSLGIGLTAQVLKGNTGADPSWGAVDLTTDVTGYCPVGSGGTGVGSITAHALIVGDGTSAINEIGLGTATQVLQSGGAGADPAWSTATYPATTAQGDVMFSSAANTVAGLTKDATATRYIANTGASNNPAWAQVNMANGVTGTLPVANGGTGFATTTAYAVLCGGTTATNPFQPIAGVGTATQVLTSNGAGALPTFQDPAAGGITWSIITANQSIVVENGYICNKAGVLALALPATAAVGTVFRVTGMNTDLGWSVTQGANQQIHFGDVSTTSGAGGSLASTLKRDSIECVCVVEDLEWNLTSSVGNITIV